jgi:gas vesicle protein
VKGKNLMTEERIYYSHDAETQALRAVKRSMVLFLAGGLAMGAAAALLLAPSSGKKTRDELGKAVEEGLHNGRDAVAPAVKQLEKELAELRKSIEERTSK